MLRSLASRQENLHPDLWSGRCSGRYQAGSLLTQFYTIYPTAGASFGFRALIVVVVGGLGSIPGAFFAGIFLGLLEQMSALFISPSYSDMIVFVTFIIILVVRQVMILRRR